MKSLLKSVLNPLIKKLASTHHLAKLLIAIIAVILSAPSAHAQAAYRFQGTQVRVTVPVSSTNSTSFTNQISFVNGATNADLTVTGLPVGAEAVLTDAASNVVSSITGSATITVTLLTTNIPSGQYLFNLNASGLDTNGLPVTNSMPYVLQSAVIWKGAGNGVYGTSNNWATATNWQGGVAPSPTDNVVFWDPGAQTNGAFTSGVAYTNVGIDANVTVSSLRFAQAGQDAAKDLYHTIRIATNVTLSVTGTNGFSLLRDTIGDFGLTTRLMGVNFSGAGGALLVSNAVANFGVLLGASEFPTLSISNLGTFSTYVSRIGIADYSIYPYYRELNAAFNGGRGADNYTGYPRRMWANFYMARTNYINASYIDPNNYTNEFTRGYGFTLQNNEQAGNGSSVNTYFNLGISNRFNVDGVCIVGSSSASGNTGGAKFGTNRMSSAYFRGTNGGRMSVFTIADDGGTNQAISNVKATVDFSGLTNYVDILADRLFIARDRTLIASNQTPNVQGDLTIGYGNVDVNTVVLGYQEHSNKVDWTTIGGAQPYLNYCQGRLVLTNGGVGSGATFRVNGNLTLGFTADINPVGSAQQYNTYGRITVYSNATLQASNIICDGGLNYYDGSGRNNTITINQGGNLIVTNAIGSYNLGANALSPVPFGAADPKGMLLDTLTLSAGKLSVFVDPSRTNVYLRTLSTPGLTPSIIKVMALTGVTSYPATIPIISYQNTPAPFLNADVTALSGTYYGYVLNNTANKTIDLYITTNAPNNLIWTGATDNNWDTTTLNWKTASGGIATNFTLGDIVRFDDSSSVTNITVVGSVVPSQTGVGVTISNNAAPYAFSTGSAGVIAGTAQIEKSGTNVLQFDVVEQGPITIKDGTVYVGSSGGFGSTTLYTNLVLNFGGTINGGLTSTGMVTLLAGSTLNGPLSLQGGYLQNGGTINVPQASSLTVGTGVNITNQYGATINYGTTGVSAGGDWNVPIGSFLANLGTINLWQNRILVTGTLFGNGLINNPNGGGRGTSGSVGYVRVQGGGVITAGTNLNNQVDTMNMYTRFDWNNDPTAAGNGFLPGVLRVDVDFSNAQTNDLINCDWWNNDTGTILMTNINPGAGAFANGQSFQILKNSSGNPTNYIDNPGFCPNIQPLIPGAGLVWNVTNFNVYGSIGITTNTMVWDGTSTAAWVTNSPGVTSWKTSLSFQDAQGALFDDTATGSTNVTLSGILAPAGITGQPISNNASIFPGVVIANSTKNYVLAGTGSIAGPTSLYKTGSGSATLLTSNYFSGNIYLQGGSLVVSNWGALADIKSLGAAGSGAMKNQLEFSGGTLNYVGLTNVNLPNYTVFNAPGGTINVASTTNTLRLTRAQVGVGTLTKTGPGILQMDQNNAVYSTGGAAGPAHTGGVTVNGGFLRLGVSSGVGSGVLTLNGGGLLTTNVNISFTNSINVAAASTFVVQSGSTNTLTGPVSGSAALTFTNTSAATFIFAGDLSNYSGTLSFGSTSGNYQFNTATNLNPCLGSALASFNLGTGSATLSNLNGGGLVYSLGSLAGGASTILGGRSTNSASITGTTYSIGANGADSTFSGKIADGYTPDVVSVVKVGAGKLLLNGISTHTGSTTVSNGVLGGTGSIASPLTVASGGTLSPGVTIGSLTVSNSLTLNGTTLMELNQSNPGQTNDLLVVTGTLTGGGALVVTNVGSSLTNGAKFKLFSKAVSGFSSTTLPTGGSGYVWNNTLSTDGFITLVSGGAVTTTPVSMSSSFSGGSLTLSWPADHIGWSLQVQTNTLSVGISTNWVVVPGSTTNTSMVIPIDSGNGSVFYRLVTP